MANFLDFEYQIQQKLVEHALLVNSDYQSFIAVKECINKVEDIKRLSAFLSLIKMKNLMMLK